MLLKNCHFEHLAGSFEEIKPKIPPKKETKRLANMPNPIENGKAMKMTQVSVIQQAPGFEESKKMRGWVKPQEDSEEFDLSELHDYLSKSESPAAKVVPLVKKVNSKLNESTGSAY